MLSFVGVLLCVLLHVSSVLMCVAMYFTICLLCILYCVGATTSPTNGPTVAPSVSFAPSYASVPGPTAYYATLYAGTGSTSYSGDGGKATAADIRYPFGMFRDSVGIFYFCDDVSRIRSVDGNDIISTYAGSYSSGFSGDGGAATSAFIDHPTAVWSSSLGVMYILTYNDWRVRSVSASGIISTYVGTGTQATTATSSNGDYGPATSATMNSGLDLCGDSLGNIYISETSNYKIRKVDTSSIITTVVGTGANSYAGDGGPATSASMNTLSRIFVGSTGYLYLSEVARLRLVDPATQLIRTFAGNGVTGFIGDGMAATSSRVGNPKGIWGDAAGQLFWAEGSQRIRLLISEGDVLYTVAGNGNSVYAGDDGYATSASFSQPVYVTGDSVGNMWVSDNSKYVIRKLTIQTPTWYPTLPPTMIPSVVPSVKPTVQPTVAPTTELPSVIPTQAPSVLPTLLPTVLPTIAPTVSPSVVPTPSPSVSLAPSISLTSAPYLYWVTLYAGTGDSTSSSGDGGKATAAALRYPFGVFRDTLGTLYVCDGVSRVRAISSSDIITTFAGGSSSGTSGDGGRATAAKIHHPSGVWASSSGVVYTITPDDYRVRAISTSSSIISTFAGSGSAPPSASDASGDGGAATSATMNKGYDLSGDSVGNLYIADTTNNKIRKVDSSGLISTFAGNGGSSYTGDGGAATSASFLVMNRIFADSVGAVFASETNRIRMISSGGNIISTVAGNGANGYISDGVAATSTRVHYPKGVWRDTNGNMMFTDTSNYRVRMVYVANSVIYTIGGTGTSSYTGDDGMATSATFSQPHYLTGDTVGHLWLSDNTDYILRKLTVQAPTWSPTYMPTAPTVEPSLAPTRPPTVLPTVVPTAVPTVLPTCQPTQLPTVLPSAVPTITYCPSSAPTVSNAPTVIPTVEPSFSFQPTTEPSVTPTVSPSVSPSRKPTVEPSLSPSVSPSVVPTPSPSTAPSHSSSPIYVYPAPSVYPTLMPTEQPSHTGQPTAGPTVIPTTAPSESPSVSPTVAPSEESAAASSGGALSMGAVIGIAVGGAVLVILAGVAMFKYAPMTVGMKVKPDAGGEPTAHDVESGKDSNKSAATSSAVVPVGAAAAVGGITAAAAGQGGAVTVAGVTKKFDVFLTHDWGTDELGRSNHKRVVEVGHYLRELGVHAWLDEEELSQNILEEMTRGIDSSHFVVVFITERYMNKVNGRDGRDNCKFEFQYAFKRLGPQSLIPVVMEARMRDQSKWGGVCGGALNSLLYVDMVSDEPKVFREKCRELKDRIEQMKLHEGDV